jgi:hypothetical protein
MSEVLSEVVHIVRQTDDSDEDDSCNRDNYPVTCTPGSRLTGSVSSSLNQPNVPVPSLFIDLIIGNQFFISSL